MTKKLFYGIVITISLFGGMNIVSAANKTVIDPEQWCDPEGVFEDPPIDEIINNGYNDYTTTTNQYCKQYCSEKVVTNFPTTVPTITVDQIIQSGGHFVWNPIQFTGTKTCYTKFDYTTWLNDYNEIIGYVGKGSSTGSGMLYSYWKWQQELHQRDSVEDTGKCVVNGKDCKKVNGTKEQFVGKAVFHEAGVYPSNHATSTMCVSDGGTWSNSTCWFKKAAHYSCEDYGDDAYPKLSGKFDVIKKDTKCYKKVEDAECGGAIYKRIQYNPDNSTTIIENKEYCKYTDTPFNANVDDFWYVYAHGGTATGLDPRPTTQTSTIAFKTLYNQMWGYYRECTGLLGKQHSENSYRFNPKAQVQYKDPVGYYSRKIDLELVKEESEKSKAILSSKSTTISVQKPTSQCRCLSGVKDCKDNNIICQTKTENMTINYEVMTQETVKSVFDLPKNTYRYTLKPDGKPVDLVPASYKNDGKYIDIGYPNYPVHYSTPTGTYPMYLTYTGVGHDGRFDGTISNTGSGKETGKYDCIYKVKNRITTSDDDDDDDDDDDCNPTDPACKIKIDECVEDGTCEKRKGLNLIYRPIDLTNPFPGRSGRGRASGVNWSKDDIATYIEKNRKVKTDDVYTKKPIYEFTLTPSVVRSIREYNHSHEFTDFNLVCKGKDENKRNTGTRCYSNFLKEYGAVMKATGTCYNKATASFYSCADKDKNQDLNILKTFKSEKKVVK